MHRKLSVLLTVLLAAVCIGVGAQEKRSVVLQIQLPNGATPQLRILEGETGTVSTPDIGKIGFVPTLKDGSVVVGLFDLNQTPSRRLGEVEARVGGDQVESGTTPHFSIRAIRIVP